MGRRRVCGPALQSFPVPRAQAPPCAWPIAPACARLLDRDAGGFLPAARNAPWPPGCHQPPVWSALILSSRAGRIGRACIFLFRQAPRGWPRSSPTKGAAPAGGNGTPLPTRHSPYDFLFSPDSLTTTVRHPIRRAEVGLLRSVPPGPHGPRPRPCGPLLPGGPGSGGPFAFSPSADRSALLPAWSRGGSGSVVNGEAVHAGRP